MKEEGRKSKDKKAKGKSRGFSSVVFAFYLFLPSSSLLLLSPLLFAEETKTREQEMIERRQRVELMGYFIKDPKDAAVPTSPQAIQLYNQAVEAFQKNEYELARQAVKESLDLQQDNPLAYELLGDIDYLEQKLPDAKANYEIAYNLQPSAGLKKKLEKLSGEVVVEKKLATYTEEHFVIKYHKAQNRDRGFELRELLRETYRKLSQDFAYYFNHQVVVLLYDDEEFKQITGLPHWAAGLYDGKIRMPINRAGFTDKELRALTAHEMTHAFVAGMSGGQAPAWINEGLAEYEENKIKPVDMIVFESAVTTNTLFPLVQLISERTVVSLEDPLLISLFYQQSFHVVNYLVQRYGMFRVKQILGEYAKGRDSEEAIQNILRISSERLEKEWKGSFTK